MAAATHLTAPTRDVEAGGIRFAYRRFGTPLLFQHFMGNLDTFDPAITDALAEGREVILFDNAGVRSEYRYRRGHRCGDGSRC
jgi:hypothetical protein